MKYLLLILTVAFLSACGPAKYSERTEINCTATQPNGATFKYKVSYMKDMVRITGSISSNQYGEKEYSIYRHVNDTYYSTKTIWLNLPNDILFKITTNYGQIDYKGKAIETDSDIIVYQVINDQDEKLQTTNVCY